ncbi:MAG: CbiX/SirB N-terminal domain-containing protein [Candidatus Omnitrophica bacterium]|nr:CbiX/SirB N-terminal domain-containing protein [Candidatus Omnitrophota bacterium]
MKKAVLIISHGSRSPKTKEEVQALIESLRRSRPDLIFELGFLELEEPSIPQGVDLCVRRGASEVAVILNFLNSGRHVDEDIPEIVAGCRTRHPDVPIHVSPPVGQHPRIVELFQDLIESS